MMDNTKTEEVSKAIEDCLKDVNDVLNRHNFELFPQVIISDKGVFANVSLRPRTPASQQKLDKQ